MIKYQKIDTLGVTAIGEPGELPECLVGLQDVSLANLDWTDPALEFVGFGFLPVEVDPPLDELKADALATLSVNHDTKFAEGFPHTFGGVAERLQMRDRDQVNWLVFKDTCNDGILAGYGAADCPQPIRVTSNAEYTVTFSEGAEIMRAMKVWGGSLMRDLWAKKDEIEEASTKEELEAVDLTF